MEFSDKSSETIVEVNTIGTHPWRPTYKQTCLHVEEICDPCCTNVEQLNEYTEVIDYLTKGKYPPDYTWEMKRVFQYGCALYTIMKGFLWRVGADKQMRRCLAGPKKKRVIEALHHEEGGGHFVAIRTA
jgi:hypothetical protein